jgi:hypothetical protein
MKVHEQVRRELLNDQNCFLAIGCLLKSALLFLFNLQSLKVKKFNFEKSKATYIRKRTYEKKQVKYMKSNCI